MTKKSVTTNFNTSQLNSYKSNVIESFYKDKPPYTGWRWHSHGSFNTTVAEYPRVHKLQPTGACLSCESWDQDFQRQGTMSVQAIMLCHNMAERQATTCKAMSMGHAYDKLIVTKHTHTVLPLICSWGHKVTTS